MLTVLVRTRSGGVTPTHLRLKSKSVARKRLNVLLKRVILKNPVSKPIQRKASRPAVRVPLISKRHSGPSETRATSSAHLSLLSWRVSPSMRLNPGPGLSFRSKAIERVMSPCAPASTSPPIPSEAPAIILASRVTSGISTPPSM